MEEIDLLVAEKEQLWEDMAELEKSKRFADAQSQRDKSKIVALQEENKEMAGRLRQAEEGFKVMKRVFDRPN